MINFFQQSQSSEDLEFTCFTFDVDENDDIVGAVASLIKSLLMTATACVTLEHLASSLEAAIASYVFREKNEKERSFQNMSWNEKRRFNNIMERLRRYGLLSYYTIPHDWDAQKFQNFLNDSDKFHKDKDSFLYKLMEVHIVKALDFVANLSRRQKELGRENLENGIADLKQKIFERPENILIILNKLKELLNNPALNSTKSPKGPKG